MRYIMQKLTAIIDEVCEVDIWITSVIDVCSSIVLRLGFRDVESVDGVVNRKRTVPDAISLKWRLLAHPDEVDVA